MANRCSQCEIMYINGIRTHETGCPLAWQDEIRECKWCGGSFAPDTSSQSCCSDDCAQDYYQ